MPVLTHNQETIASSTGVEALAREYLRLLKQGVAEPADILVLLPSNRAVQALTDLIESLLGRRSLESAHIQTIHGFCSRVLRQNALIAGVDPGFSILADESIAGRLADEIIASHEADLRALGLLRDEDPDAVRESLLALYDRIRIEPDAGIAPVTDPLPFLEAFERCCREIIAPNVPVEDWSEKRLQHIKRDMAKALIAASRLADHGRFDWKTFRKLGEYRGRFRNTSGSFSLDHLLAATRTALDDLMAACLDRQSALCADLLLSLASEFGARYSAEKARLGLLDFDDLLSRTSDFLRDDSETARRYREEFKFVMALDRRDIGVTQRDIISAISKPDNFIVVPDAMQPASSVRCREGIIGFVNRLVGAVWGEDPGVRIEALKCAGDFESRSDPDVELVLIPRQDARTPEAADRRHRAEARMIAQRILDITGRSEAEPFTRSRRDVAGRSIEFRDIVVLLRSAADLRTCAGVLEDHGIPACALGGRGFYSAREIQDLVSLLKVLDDPQNDPAIAEVLLSPLVGISEDALSKLCMLPPALAESWAEGRLSRAVAGIEEIADIEKPDRAKLADFRDLLLDLLTTRFSMGVADILELALERSRFELRVLTMKGGRRRYANVRKFREIARQSQSAGQGLSEFLAQIEESELLGGRESEAAVESEEGNVVRIMTVYVARELHAPVVFVADLSHPFDSRQGLVVLDSERGLAVSSENPFTRKLETPLSYREISDSVHDAIVSEEKSLLPMAMTRAEERLILVGSSGLGGDYGSTYRETRSWAGWLEKALGLGPGSPQGDLSFGPSRVRFSYGPPKPIKPSSFIPNPPPVSRYAREFREGLPIEDVPEDPAALEVSRDAVIRCLAEESPIRRRVSRVSVSRALDYLQCPARYRLLHIIGMPETGGDPREDAEEPEIKPADLGHVVHDLLSRVDFTRGVPAQLRDLVSEIADEPLKAETRRLVEAFAQSRWCDALRASDRILKETPFELLVGRRVLAGRMDVMFHDADGWTVLDYKTGRAEDRERYQLQVGIYAHAAHRLIGEMPARAALILLSAGEEWVQDTSDGAAARSASQTIERVIAAVDEGRFDANPGRHCDWCSVAGYCRKELFSAK